MGLRLAVIFMWLGFLGCSYDFKVAASTKDSASSSFSTTEGTTMDTSSSTQTGDGEATASETPAETQAQSISDTASESGNSTNSDTANDTGGGTTSDTVSDTPTATVDTATQRDTGGDVCGEAIALPGPGTYHGSLAGLSDDFAPMLGACSTVPSSMGEDQFFSIQVKGGTTLVAVLVSDGFEMDLAALSSCGDLEANCLVRERTVGNVATLSVSFLEDQTVFLVCDALLPYSGEKYDLTVSFATGVNIGLHYYEFIDYFADMDVHEIWVGPGTSTDPEDGSWDIVAYPTDLDGFAAALGWTAGFVPNLSSYSGSTVRLAFHYKAENGDNWYLDDMCLSTSLVQGYPGPCFFSEGFESTSGAALPDGWSTFAGAENTSSFNWMSTSDNAHGSLRSVMSQYANLNTVEDRYLVSPPISLP